MGTTLTGTTPQDTYDSLIKVTDNGPLSGTLKALSDGLGNDSTLSLSTTAASIAGTLAVTGNATFDTSTLVVDAANNRVGIGTATPTVPLDVVANSSANTLTLRTRSGSDDYSFVQFKNNAGTEVLSEFFAQRTGTSTGRLGFSTNDGATILERLSISSDGYVRLTTNSSGIQFNGDTAAANALDDYEEGTFTATLTPSTSGTITSSASFTTWSYTKIGRQVTINGAFVISSVSSPVGDLVNVGGLPFAVRNNNDSFGALSAGYADASLSFAKSALWAVHGTNTTTINLGINASTVAASDEFYVTATYFV